MQLHGFVLWAFLALISSVTSHQDEYRKLRFQRAATTTTTSVTTSTMTCIAPTSCAQFGTGQQVPYSKSGPFDRYITTCNRNFYATGNNPVTIHQNVPNYKACLDKCFASNEWIAATYRQSDQACHCFTDYSHYNVGDTVYDGAFKSSSTSSSCNYVPPAVERVITGSARFALYGSSTFGATGGSAYLRSIQGVSQSDCVNLCISEGSCSFFQYSQGHRSCMLYNNNGNTGICAQPSDGEVAGVKVMSF